MTEMNEHTTQTPATMPTRILVVDDHTLFRRGLTALLSRDARVAVVGDAADAGEAPHQPLPSVPDREAVRYRKCGDPSLTYAEQSVCCRGEANEVIASETDARLRAELGIKKFGSCMVFSSAVKANASKP